MRRVLTGLAIAALAGVPAVHVNAAPNTNVPAWLQALALRDSAAMGDAQPRSVSYRINGPWATISLSGRFVCGRSCPMPPHGGPRGGPVVTPRGTRATLRVDMRTRMIMGLGLTYPALNAPHHGSASPPARMQFDFFEAKEGPATAFSSLQRQPGLSPSGSQVTISARARRIGYLRFKGHGHTLLLAPTQAGGFCTSLSGAYGGTSCPLTSALRRGKGALAPGMTGDASGPILFNGYFTVTNAARLQVTYQNGRRDTIPFAWVNSPIRAGFFLYDLTAHRRPGQRPVALTLLDTRGRQLDQQPVSS
jgi:hypothetical protein